MPRPAKFTKEQLQTALSESDGDLLRVALLLNVNLATVYRAIKRYGVLPPKDDAGGEAHRQAA